jgi:hypothetical protein
MYYLTKKSMKMLVEEIVYAVHESENDEKAKEWVQEVLEDRGIVEVEEDVDLEKMKIAEKEVRKCIETMRVLGLLKDK